MIDPSPTTPVEAEAAEKRRIVELFQQESVKISEELKVSSKRNLVIDLKGQHSFQECKEAARRLKGYFEGVGWEVGVRWIDRDCRYNLEFHLPGTRANKRRIFAIVAAAIMLVGGALLVFRPWKASEIFPGQRIEESGIAMEFSENPCPRYENVPQQWGGNLLDLDEEGNFDIPEVALAALRMAAEHLPPGINAPSVQKLTYYPAQIQSRHDDGFVGLIVCTTQDGRTYATDLERLFNHEFFSDKDYFFSEGWREIKIVRESYPQNTPGVDGF